MAENKQTPSNPEDLELAQRILELTTYLQKNSDEIEGLKSKVVEMDSKSQDLDINLGKKLNEFNDDLISKMKDDHDKLYVENEKLKELLETQRDYFTSEIKALTEVIEAQENHFNEKTSSQKEVQENLLTSFKEQGETIENLSRDLKEGFSETNKNLEQSESSLKSSVSALGELVRTQFETVTKSTNSLDASVDSLNSITQAHTEAFTSVRESLLSFKEKLYTCRLPPLIVKTFPLFMGFYTNTAHTTLHDLKNHQHYK